MNYPSINEALQELYSLQWMGIKLGLENTEKFLNIIDNPHKKLKVFHVAGSNGKGSTASYIASILMEAGFKTALYTSPHFVRFNERIRINGDEIPDEYILAFIAKHMDYAKENKLTFFEFTTAMAFAYFAEQKVHYAVIETGLGGRLDSTNVVDSLAAVITSISLEHTNILGSTIAQIAKEKAAIIKKCSKVFCGLLPDEALQVIEDKCDENENEFYHTKEYINKRDLEVELYTEEVTIDRLETPLRGFYQKYNSALAILTVIKTLDINDEYLFRKGIKNVILNTGIQGRFETLHTHPKIVIDSAHNAESMQNFVESLLEERGVVNRKVLFTALHDKNIPLMLKQLKRVTSELIITEIDNPRACSLEELKTFAENEGFKVTASPNLKELLNQHLQNPDNETLLIVGSMYLLGEVKAILKEITE